MAKQFTRRPACVEAIQWRGDNVTEMSEFGVARPSPGNGYDASLDVTGTTLHLYVDRFDWVVRRIDGVIETYPDDEFSREFSESRRDEPLPQRPGGIMRATQDRLDDIDDAAEFRTRAPRVTLSRLQAVNDARKERWHQGGTREWSTLEWAGAMCGEAGEAANVAKKLLRIDLGLRGNEAAEHVITERDALRANLAGEIGGIVLYCALLASEEGIDFERAVVETFNSKSQAMGFPERL